MADAPAVATDQECRTFTRYLCGMEASDYVLHQYARGLASAAFRDGPPVTSLDLALEAFARRGVATSALADTWARFVAPGGRLRRRLVLLLSILETGPAAAAFEPPAAGRARAFIELALLAMRFALLLPATLLIVGPLHLGVVLRGRARVS